MPTTPDPERLPVVIASGQTLERHALVNPVDLMERAASVALGDAPDLRHRIQRLTVVNVLTKVGPAPAAELADRLGLGPDTVTEVTTVGGNTPQWLVNRAASEIAAGSLRATLVAGAEAIRSSRARRSEGLPRDLGAADRPPDPLVGDALPGFGAVEAGADLIAPLHVYALLESAVAARAGRDAAAHRRVMGALLAPFTRVAATHPCAWFPEARTADEIATPAPDNRIVAEPYTKRMAAFLGSDQGAALLVCSLAEARRAGVADRAVFIWAGCEATDVRSVTARPDLGRSPAVAAAGRILFAAASEAAGRAVTIDDVELVDLYSCFPSAVELTADALGLATDDHRGLTVTGGLPYFGGPGNNYATHGIATLTDRLRSAGGGRLGLATGLGWFVTKHALGIYGATPPPAGFRRGDTGADQSRIDASARATVLGVDHRAPATVVGATVVRDGAAATAAPVVAELADGRRMALAAADDGVRAAVGELDVASLVGRSVVVEPGPARYRLAER